MRNRLLIVLGLGVVSACAQDPPTGLAVPGAADAVPAEAFPPPAYGEFNDVIGEVPAEVPWVTVPIPDIVSASALAKDGVLTIHTRFRPPTFTPTGAQRTQLSWYFDIDQDPATGMPGMHVTPPADVGIMGVEWLVAYNLTEGTAQLFRWISDRSFVSVQNLTAVVGAFDITISVPLSALGNDDGLVNTKLYAGIQFSLMDVAPPFGGPPLATAPLTPGRALAFLENDIAVLLDGATLTPAQATGLSDKLAAAFASDARGNCRSACNQLGAFINQAQAFINNGTLTPAEGEALIGDAEYIRGLMGC